jgi:hypothetical protein
MVTLFDRGVKTVGDNGRETRRTRLSLVIPANAGIQFLL